LTAEVVDELVQAYREGATLKELVGRFGICQTSVIAHLDRRGVQRRQPDGLSAEQVREGALLYEGGLSLAAVGERLGFNKQTVRKYLVAGGVTMRPNRGGRRR
jgi:hypothetical protein